MTYTIPPEEFRLCGLILSQRQGDFKVSRRISPDKELAAHLSSATLWIISPHIHMGVYVLFTRKRKNYEI